jgi:uncharacterized protein YdeI (YjbR/CyaY-like superfamily)
MESRKSVEEFLASHPERRDILNPLRDLFLSTELEETVKWGVPVYTLDGKNVAGLTAFKNYAAIWFFQGALLKDEEKQLINAQEGVTRAQRQWRFQSASGIDKALVRAYIDEAIRNQRQGKFARKSPPGVLNIPTQLSQALAQNNQLATSFNALSPYRQREFADYISGAKQETTKERRLKNIIPMITDGIGLNDKYRR